MLPGQIISTILKHDDKVTSYKFALLRAINDVALNFPDQRNLHRDIAVPLRVLAQFWVAYYWSNELWNLVPTDPKFNSNEKSDRLPSPAKLQQAQPHLELAYRHYSTSNSLSVALQEDVAVRFSTVSCDTAFPLALATAVIDFINIVAESRNLARF